MDYLYETHVHTAEVSACAGSSAAAQVRTYKQNGYAGIIVTDHFVNGYSTCPKGAPWEVQMRHFYRGYENAKKAGDECGLDVFFGWEYTIKGSDFLTYGLDMDFLLANPNFDLLTIEEYSALVRNNGGFLAQAHPYRDAWYVEKKYPVESHLIDALEVYNSMDSDSSNKKAHEYAKRHDLPIQAGSDAHNERHQRYSGIKMADRAKNISDVIKAITSKNVMLI
ncbi:MAG: histidinol phosphatase [Oscillospiraceae bacterium]|nr:histidinol phosphatase [Oscillospiraceae bacterium]